jgi:hypothetical protein
MRKIAIILITILGVAFITSCKKDEVKTLLGTSFTAPVISTGLTNGSTVVLNKANKDAAINISWSAAMFGFRASVTYTLQMDKKGNNFASALSLGSPSSTLLSNAYTLSIITNDLNNQMLKLQADPENPVPTALEFRVKAYISDSVPVIYSPVISATYTPYFIPIIYPKVYVPGGYQAASGYVNDWSPGDPYLASLKSDGKYEGYVNFAVTGEYKITSEADWNGTNWGAGAAAGTLSATGGNIVMAAPGYYKVNVNTNESTISLLKTSWSIIGSVNAPYDWTKDVDMTYNPTTRVWTATADLHAGEFKFRNNHDWGFAYGIGAAPGKLDSSGGNIPLAADGNYTITLDFSVPPIYRYKIVKN